jgi:sigma-B regulation protein RsbU (phosphoserine phosphatase)
MLLRRRLLLLFAAIVAAVLVAGVAGAVVIRNRDESRDSERRLSVAQEEAAQLTAAYADEETAVRGYVLAGDARFLAPYTTGGARATRLLRSLDAIRTQEHALADPLARVVERSTRWRSQAAERAITLRASGDVAGATAAATATGKQLFDQLRQSLTALTRVVNAEADTADHRAATARTQLTVIFAVILGVALLGTLAAAYAIRRWVTRPINDLGRQVRRIRVGASGQVIQQVGPPEIAALASHVDAMRARIESQRIQAERSREAVEQSAAVVLTLRAQLEPDLGELPRGWTIAAQLRAAEGVVAGDCYGLVSLDDEHVGLVVVDIAGHGAVEGILALRCKELLRASLAADYEPGEAMRNAAEQLGDLGEEVFLTAFVAVIDTADGRVRYANAGHPPAFIASELQVLELGPTGPLVGLLDDHWHTAVARIDSGDALCAYTDGLIEVRAADGAFYGPERLMHLVQGARCDQAPAVVKRCLDEVEAFAGGHLRDDATVVVLCRP